MNNLIQSYKIILTELRKMSIAENAYFKPIKPKLTDLEIISLSFVSEFLSIKSEYQLFRYLVGTELENKIERSVYNKRKRKLFSFIEEIRMKMILKFNENENYLIIDSMPLEVCKNTQDNRSKSCK